MPIAEQLQAGYGESFAYDNPASSLDMASVLLNAYELGDLINASGEVAEYLYWKKVVEDDEQVQQARAQFLRAKQLFEECERFGRFHPDFHAAKDKVKLQQAQLDTFECVVKFKAAEQTVERLLLEVSQTIAHAVSASIKVPGLEAASGGGSCGSGGACSCSSGGCS